MAGRTDRPRQAARQAGSTPLGVVRPASGNLAGLKARVLRASIGALLGDDTEIVTLCGSMRFFPQMLDVASELTTLGVIVLSPFMVVPTAEQTSALKARLDTLHRRKIAMSDQVVVVTDASRYVGASTRAEIAYATRLHLPVTWAVRENGGAR